MSPWTVRESLHVLRDRWISIRSDKCATAEGVSVEPYYVLEYPDFVNVFALTEADEVLLVCQYRHAVKEVLIELPGGMIDSNGETPADAVRRELLEETGYASDEYIPTGVLFPNPATHTNRAHCFVATNCRRISEPCPDETESLEVHLVPFQEFTRDLLSDPLLQSLHLNSALLALAKLGHLRLPMFDSPSS